MSRFASLDGTVVTSHTQRIVLVFALILATAACGLPTPDSSGSTLPDAQATSVRRTAVAEVQRVIAGDPPPTPPPLPTATQPPTCSSAIWWHEARSHIGESRTVQGPVVRLRTAANSRTMLELGQQYPDPTGVIVFAPARAAAGLVGKTICVAGRITGGEASPSIEVRDAAAIVVVN